MMRWNAACTLDCTILFPRLEEHHMLQAYAVVFSLSSINGACTLSDAFRRSWDMDMAHLNCMKCEFLPVLQGTGSQQ